MCIVWENISIANLILVVMNEKGLSFISYRQWRKEGTFCASELAGIEPTPPAPENKGMPAFGN
jgi:hypothetical protein